MSLVQIPIGRCCNVRCSVPAPKGKAQHAILSDFRVEPELNAKHQGLSPKKIRVAAIHFVADLQTKLAVKIGIGIISSAKSEIPN